MDLNRRQFLILTTAAAAVAGCRSLDEAGRARVVDAGAVSDYAADGVYSDFRDQGFFVIRNGLELFVMSAICTHRKCKLIAVNDRSFFCKCHGSTFASSGRVTSGPASRNLPRLPSVVTESGQLLVTVGVEHREG